MKLIEVAAAVIQRGDSVLLARRPDDKHQGGKWEFPGGKIEIGEQPVAALRREIKEELDLTIRVAIPYEIVEHRYTDQAVKLYFYRVSDFTGEARGMEGQEIAWVKLAELAQLDFPAANELIVKMLCRGGSSVAD